MKGTPAQVRWATSVRAEKMRVIEPELEAMHARGSVEAVAATRRVLESAPASWWLDRRNDEPLVLLATAGHLARNGACRATNGMDIDV